MITRVAGSYIINGGLFTLGEGQVVSHPTDAVVEAFNSAEEAEAEHRRRYPDVYAEHDYDA